MPVNLNYSNAMKKLILAAVLCLAAKGPAQEAPTPDVIATYPVTLHEHLSPSCEVIQPATLIQHKDYDAIVLSSANGEIYSPELGTGDFVGVTAAVPNKAVKSAKKSGFEVRPEPSDASGQSAQTQTKGDSCSDSQRALKDANDQRHERMIKLLTQLYRFGSDVTPPVSIKTESPNVQSGAQSGGAKQKTKDGIVVVAFVVGVDGKVHDVQVVRSLNPTSDQKAIEGVRQLTFLPARLHGLPVPFQISVEANLHLY